MTAEKIRKENWLEYTYMTMVLSFLMIAAFFGGRAHYIQNLPAFILACFVAIVSVCAVAIRFDTLLTKEKVLSPDDLEVGKRYFCESRTATDDPQLTIYILRDGGKAIVARAPETFIPESKMLRVSLDKKRLEADKEITTDEPIFKNRKL